MPKYYICVAKQQSLGAPKMSQQYMKGIILVLLLLIGTTLSGCIGGSEDKIGNNGDTNPTPSQIRIAFMMQDDYENINENPQRLADYISNQTGIEVILYPIDSEGAALEALRFGNADIALMDGGAAWVGWNEYGLEVMAADQKSDGRTYYNAHAWVLADSEIASAHLDNDPNTDPFSLMQGKTSCHTGWLKSAGMLLPMGYLISNNYAPIVGDENDIESLRDTIHSFFNENASIPDSGTQYYGYSGALHCLSEGVGGVAFAKDSTIDSYCGNDNTSENEEWCLATDQYIALPAFGQAPSHPIMYNPDKLDDTTRALILETLLSLNNNSEGQSILGDVLNTPGIVEVNTEEHMESYGELIGAIPGISTYFDDKFEIINN